MPPSHATGLADMVSTPAAAAAAAMTITSQKTEPDACNYTAQSCQVEAALPRHGVGRHGLNA
jgi:hypothetical protein